MSQAQARGPLNLDQQRVLDLVAELALKGYDARPSYLAHTLNIPRQRVDVALAELCALGMVLSTTGRTL